jgi:lysophospholipase L1-like esterase
MRKISLTLIFLCCVATMTAQTPALKYIDATQLNVIGKIAPTPQPYHRIDTQKYGGFTDYQQILVKESAGLKVCFKTNSSTISIKSYYSDYPNANNMTVINQLGYTLYIKKDGKWLYAGSGGERKSGKPWNIVSNMKAGEKECLLYMPSFAIVDTLQIGVDSNATITASANPFRHRIVLFGSSFTHGTCANRPGMSYPMILERNTGLHIINLGMSGNSELQQSFARVLADADADAFIFDAFSNPLANTIEERFDDFVKTIRAKHPTTPLIFMQTIYRENRNFDEKYDKREQDKMDVAEKVVKNAMKTDKNIYFINPKNMTGDDHDTSTDGIHPCTMGYARWADAIERPIVKILSKYGIK